MGSRTGIVVLSLFAALWLVFAKFNGAPLGWATIIAGSVVSVLLVFASYQMQLAAPGSEAQRERIGRIYMWASIGEGLGIFVIVNALANVGLADRFMAGIALAVGLHFIPPAFLLNRHRDFLYAAVLLAAAVAGFAIPSAPLAALVVGVTGALTLWAGVATELLVLRRQA